MYVCMCCLSACVNCQVLRALKGWDSFVFKTATAETSAAEEDPRPAQKVFASRGLCLLWLYGRCHFDITLFEHVDHHAVWSTRHGKGERGCRVTSVASTSIHVDRSSHIHCVWVAPTTCLHLSIYTIYVCTSNLVIYQSIYSTISVCMYVHECMSPMSLSLPILADDLGTYGGSALRLPGAGGERLGRSISAGSARNHLLGLSVPHH